MKVGGVCGCVEDVSQALPTLLDFHSPCTHNFSRFYGVTSRILLCDSAYQAPPLFSCDSEKIREPGDEASQSVTRMWGIIVLKRGSWVDKYVHFAMRDCLRILGI